MIAIFFQDTSEFNVATSSLHALSNSMAMSRTDKQSPHSSPRLARRSVTPNLCSVANLVQTNDIYASQMQHHPAQSQTSIASSASSNGNGSSASGKAYNAARSSAGSTMQPVCFAQANLNRMSAPSMSTTSITSATQQQQCVVNKALSKAQSAEINDSASHSGQDSTAPPLPPRKASPVVDNLVNRMLKPSNAPSAPSHSSLLSSTTITSSENVTTCELDVPQTDAPPIPKHNAVKSNHNDHTFEDDLKHIHLSSEENGDRVIVGPAETISGIIDTRPIDARKPIVSNLCVTTEKDPILVTPNGANNVYHLKMGGNGSHQSANQQDQIQPVQKHPPNQTRHQSFPSNSGSGQSASSGAHTSMPSKSQTTPHFGSGYVKLNTTTTPTSIASAASSSRSDANISCTSTDDSGTSLKCARRDAQQPHQQPLLYENISLNNKDCNVPYENINLEYIARLMNEGYSKENVITALGISRNNIEMACDILHEFVSKSSV